MFSGIHNVLVDWMKNADKGRFYGVELLVQEVCISDMDF